MAYILAQQQIRQAVVAAIQALGAQVETPGDTTIPDSRLPVVQVRSPGARKSQDGHGPLSFTTVVDIEIECKCVAQSAPAAQAALEQLLGQIEVAVIPCQAIYSLVQQLVGWDCRSAYSSEARMHVGEAKITASYELPELFDPLTDYPIQPVATDLAGVNLHADLTNVFDPSGTYSNPEFPLSVTSAPRTTGPDGRDEGYLQIDLSGD